MPAGSEYPLLMDLTRQPGGALSVLSAAHCLTLLATVTTHPARWSWRPDCPLNPATRRDVPDVNDSCVTQVRLKEAVANPW